MSIDSALAAGRRAAEARMTDACTIATVSNAYDDATASYVPTRTTVYAGMCELKAEAVETQDVNRQAVMVVVQQLMLKLPIDGTSEVSGGHEVTITACVNDPGMVGRVYLVQAFQGSSRQTVRRIPLKEVQAA